MKARDGILSIDIGGTKIKATVLNQAGEQISVYQKIKTPKLSSPEQVVKAILTLIKDFPAYDRVSVGFPGYVKNGIVRSAPNLAPNLWIEVPFAQQLSDRLGKPVRLLNDADMQALGIVQGQGFEIVITLGTGFGTALLMNGHLLPHMELAHLPIKTGKTYDEYLGKVALKKVGTKHWNNRLKKVLTILETVFQYDRLYIGGGNAKKINFKLADNIKSATNEDGIKGGAKLWQLDDHYGIISSHD
ncbi:ROK family protein [Reichenbachiella agarivorans]|uniref:ROK family protein n=1 Tax=Reichenbachiella agarivorans TaxID=2979464 RepID=A0ABY6CM25_9BACT|nr:ROK family protein [Reichenbachiella agarivorans]UXP31569.1 ROK family protein [Reichenbachiella agarivorans]